MLTLSRDGERITLVRRRPLRAVTVSGCLVGVLSTVPLLIAPELGLPRLLTVAVLALTSAALLRLGWSRPERRELVKKDGGLAWGAEPLPPPAFVELAGTGNEEPPTYQALVRWADGRARVALEGDEPARVLLDALELADALGIELRPGWGLEKHFASSGFVTAWRELGSFGAVATPAFSEPVELPLWPRQRRAASMTLASGLFVLVVTLVLVRSPDRSVGPSALSLALPELTSGLGLVLGTLLLGLRRRVRLTSSGIESAVHLFGFALPGSARGARLGAPASRAFAVAPDGGMVRHVLFATGEGPLAIVADPDGALRIAARMTPSSAHAASTEQRLEGLAGPQATP